MPAPLPAASKAVLWRESRKRVDAYASFDRKRGHRLPTAVTSRATAFVRDLAAGDVAREVEGLYGGLRKHLGLKRRQIDVALGADAAVLAAPGFEIHLVVDLAAEQPAEARHRLTIQDVRSPELLFTPGFAALFGAGFDGLDLRVDPPVDVAGLVDHLEEREPPGWRLDYGFEATVLELAHPELPVVIEVTAPRIRLRGRRPQPAAILSRGAEAALSAMGGEAALGSATLGS